jgi:tetratricopeptide (TPR) repeat protein
MNPEPQPTLQLQSLTEAALLNCGITHAGQWVIPHQTHAIRQPTLQEKAHLRASFYWLNVYRPQPESSPHKEMQGYLEALQHLIQIEAWDLVQQVLFLPIQNPRTQKQTTQPFHQQLGTWGFYREQIELYQTLLDKISPEVDCFCLEDLGHAHICLCEYETAIACYQSLLNLAEKLHSPIAEVKALGGLGRCYTFWGQYKLARQYCDQQLQLLYSIHTDALENTNQTDRSIKECFQIEKGRTLAALGYQAYFQKQSHESVGYFQESLAIAQPLHDTQTEWYALGGLAIAYSQLGKHAQAIAALEEQSQQPHLNPYQMNVSLLNLTTAYLYQSNFQSALDCQQQLLERSQQHKDIRAQCYALMYMTMIYFIQHQDSLALQPLQQGLKIAQKFHYTQLECQFLSFLASIYSSQREGQKAMKFAQQALAIIQSQDDIIPRYKASVYAALGLAHFAEGHLLSGLCAIATTLAILPPWNSEDGKLVLTVILKRLLTPAEST